MIYIYLSIAFVVGYIFGNINFARIFSWKFSKKRITEVGSKNPGTMNMLRTRGFGEALLTLAFEAMKVGVPALACFFLFKHYYKGYENLAYFLLSFGGIIGHCFPILYKFKGGKGVACAFGMFLFHPVFWWISLVLFVVGFVSFFFIPYAFVVTLSFVLLMSICATCFFTINQVSCWIALVVILWLNAIFILILHRGNFKRLFSGQENRVNFKEKVFKKKVASNSTTSNDAENTMQQESPPMQKADETKIDENFGEENEQRD